MSNESRVRTVRLKWSIESVPRIRHAIVDDLSDGSVSEEIIDECELVVSELVANAIRYGRPLPDGTVRVHWKVRSPRVEVEVTDGGGDGVPMPKPKVEWASGGRGLRIVRSLAHEWGVTDERQGRTVWASLGGPSRRRA